MRHKIIRNTEPYCDGLFSDNDLVSKAYGDAIAKSKAYVDSEDGKRDTAIAHKPNRSDVFIKDNSGNLDMGGKGIINLKTCVEDDD